MAETPSRDSGRRTVGERILRASAIVFAAHMAFKLSALLFSIVLAHYYKFGTPEQSPNLEPFLFAWDVILFGFFFLFGEKAIGPAFLPIFMELRDRGEEDEAWRFANTIFTVQALLLTVVVLSLCLFPAAPAQFFAWLTAADLSAEKAALTAAALRWSAPALIFISLGSLTYMILNGYKRFFWAAFGDATTRFVQIAAIVLGAAFLMKGDAPDPSLRLLTWGVLAGGIGKLLTHFWGLRSHLRRLHWRTAVRSPAFTKFLILMAPLLLGILVARLRDSFNGAVLFPLEEHEMTAHQFGRKIYTSLGWLVPYAISLAMFPYLCELVDRDDKRSMGEFYTQSSRVLLYFFIPLSLAVIAVSLPLTRLLFQTRQGLEGIRQAALVNTCYTLVLPAYALEYLLMQGFFANRRMVTPIVLGIVFSFVSIGASFVAIRLLGWTGNAALMAVALGFTVSRTIKVLFLVVCLKRTVPMLPARSTLLFLGKALLVGAATLEAAWLARLGFERLVDSTAAGGLELKLMMAGELAWTGLVGGIVFLGMSWLLRMEEPKLILAWARAKLAHRRARRGDGGEGTA